MFTAHMRMQCIDHSVTDSYKPLLNNKSHKTHFRHRTHTLTHTVVGMSGLGETEWGIVPQM